jgi:hypothetical protein
MWLTAKELKWNQNIGHCLANIAKTPSVFIKMGPMLQWFKLHISIPSTKIAVHDKSTQQQVEADSIQSAMQANPFVSFLLLLSKNPIAKLSADIFTWTTRQRDCN